MGSLLMIWGGFRGKPVRVEVMMGVARVVVERQARKRMEIAMAILACVDPAVTVCTQGYCKTSLHTTDRCE